MNTDKPMLTARQFLLTEIRPTLRTMHRRFRSPSAECMLAAIPAQETNYASVYQIGSDGQPLEQYARGLYQFEETGVKLCINHVNNQWLRDLLIRRGYDCRDYKSIHYALPASSTLAVWVARGNLWWLPQPLPAAEYEAEEEAWLQYIQAWNPGKPDRARWTPAWQNAVWAVTGELLPASTPTV